MALFATTLCNQFDTLNIGANKQYVVQTNCWNCIPANNSMCLNVDATTGNWNITTQTNSLATNGAPAAYPSIFAGCHWGNCTSGSGMPIQVSAMGQVTTSWTVTSASGSWDIAYDIWFNSTSTTAGQPDDTEIMFWLNRSGPQPVGGVVASNVTVAGYSVDVWEGRVCSGTCWNVVSYVSRTALSSVSNLSVTALAQDSVGRGYTKASSYLIAIEAGSEPWSGDVGFASNNFSVHVGGGATPTATSRPRATPTATTPPRATATATARPRTTATATTGSTPTATARPTATSMARATATPTTSGSSSLRVQYKAGDTIAGDNQIKPFLTIVNGGSAGVPLSELTVRYWYTIDGDKPQTYFCDYAQVGAANVSGTFVKLASARTGADYYLELHFTAGAGSINAGGTSGEIQNRFAKTDWTNYNETGDYSFDPTKTAAADWSRVTLYRNGTLVWGVEP